MKSKYFDYIKNPANMTLLTQGGSERNFYRIRLDGNKTLVYMNYTDEKDENEYYYDIYLLFEKLNINVADVYYKEKGSIFLEDLGDLHLYNLITAGREDGLYFKVLDRLRKLHSEGKNLYEKDPFKISPAFNYSLYRWESKYFLDNLVKNYFNVKADGKELEEDFHFLAENLSKERNVLIHRDCQSKNIMIKNGEPFFIDFQGMRYGLPQYDLASLFEDPYANLSEKVKETLLKYYCDSLDDKFLAIYRYCAIQRLMQALGAYAFLGLVKDKKEFLRYIPSGLKNLRSILNVSKDFPGLKRLLAHQFQQ